MTTQYKDNANVIHEFQEEAGDAGGDEKRPVAGMPAAVRSQFTAMAASLVDIQSQLTTLRGHVDGLEGFTDGIETLIGSTNTLLTAVDGHVDGLEGFTDGLEGFVDGIETAIASTNTKLDTLIAASGQGATARMGQNDNIDTGANRTFTSQALTAGCWIKNMSTAGQIIYYNTSGTVASNNSVELLPGEWSEWIPCSNVTAILMLPSANDAKACYHGW